MPNENLAADRLQLTLARTTAAALAVSSVEGDVFGGLARRLAEILEVDAAMIAQFIPEQPGRVRSLATWLDGRLLKPFEYDLEGSPCRGVVNRESRFVAFGVHDEFRAGTLFHAQGFDSYAAHSMVDAGGRQLGLIVALHRAPMADRALTEALLQIFAVRATAELERRRVEEAARASEISYRSIFEATEDAIFVHDFDTGRIIDVNPRACRAYGYTRDELLAIRISEVSSNVYPYTEAEAIAKIEQAKRGGPIRFEWHRRNKDGSLHWDEVVLKTAMIGGTRRILAFTREITQRKEAEEALRLREEQYRAIFEGSADALVLWNRDIRIVDVNAAFLQMYGFERDEVIGATFSDRQPPDTVRRRIEHMRRALAGEACQLDTITVKKSGEIFEVELRYLPIIYRGEPHVLAIGRDITERKRADARLRTSEERYRQLFELVSDAIVLVDAATLKLVDVNRAAVALYGYSRDELLALTAQDLSAEPASTADAVGQSGTALSIPLRWHRRKNGSVFPVEIAANRFELESRSLWLATVRDITERHEREQALQRSEEQYRAIFNASADALVLWDSEYRRVDVNLAYQKMYGWKREDVIGRGYEHPVFPPEYSAARLELVRRALAGEHCSAELEAIRSDGTRLWTEVHAIPFAHRGEPHVLAIARDITERKQAEEALRLREEQYRAIFEGSADALVLWNRDIRIVDVNAAFTAMYGFTRDEIIGSTFGDRLPTIDVARRIRMMHRALAGEHGQLETRTIRKNGEAFDVEIRYLPIQHRGEPHVLAIARDVTERRRAEQRLKASEERYRLLFELESDAIMLADAQTLQILDANRAALAMYGYTREELLEVSWHELSADPALTTADLQQGDGTVTLPPRRHRRKDGSEFLVEATLSSFELDGRRIELAAIRDVSERFAREQELRRSEERLRATIESAIDCVIAIDGNGRILEFNPAAERCFGHERSTVLGRSLAEIAIPPRHRAAHVAGMNRFRVTRGGPYIGQRVETTALRADGTEFPIEITIGVAPSRDGDMFIGYLRDITERKLAEQALRDSEEQYRAIFNASVDGMFLRDVDFRIVDVNPAYLAMKGFAREELIGTTRIFSPSAQDEAERRETHRRVLEGSTARYETLSLRKDGSWVDVEVRAMPVLYRGHPHVLYSVRDITERKRAVEALRTSEEQYRAIFEAATDALQLIDAQHRVVDVNPAYERMYSRRREDVIGRTIDELVPVQFREERRALIERALAGGGAELQSTAFRSDGSAFQLEIRVIPFQHRGQPHVLGIARDITERKRTEEALRASEEQYRAIFNASADGMYLRDANFKIVDVNPAYLAMKGLPREQLVGTAEIMPGSVRGEEELRAQHKRVLAGESVHYETKALRGDGSWFDVEVRCMPLQYRGEPHVLYSARDITDRRRAEADRAALEVQLQQAQKMEAIGHLTGGIAHDFNNILTSVMGYMVLASERPAAEADVKLQEHLEQAQLACRRARDLIRQMLTFSRGQRGAARPTAVRTLIEESARLLRAMMPATIDLVTRTHCENAIALIDPVQAQQILLNLCINARDAMDGAGRIDVECREVELGSVGCASCRHHFSGRFIEVSVADSGSGIPAHVAERMFEPFYSTKEVGKGTGMGLAMVHGIVHDLGGHIVVDTGRGKGTVFRVLLPPAQLSADEAATDARPSRERAQLSGRVLLVDDEISVLGFMRQLLESWGLQVVTTLHPDDALHWFSVEPENFDLVLTDQTMPGMTGIELARELKRIRPGLPVLLYSGHSELLRVAPLDHGVLKVLTKPVDPAEMRAAMAQALAAENRGQTPIS